MKWSVDTYIRDNPDNLPLEVIINLKLLPEIRDEVFFPSYEEFGYVPKEPVIRSTPTMRLFEIGLISDLANRSLNIIYGWGGGIPPLNGVFIYPVYNLDGQRFESDTLDVHVLAKKRTGTEIGGDVKLKKFHGTFREIAEAGLFEIKKNCNFYAGDVIVGKYWDGHAYNYPQDEY